MSQVAALNNSPAASGAGVMPTATSVPDRAPTKQVRSDAEVVAVAASTEIKPSRVAESSAPTREALRTQLLEALARRKRRVTMSDEAVERGTNAHKRAGVFFGQW